MRKLCVLALLCLVVGCVQKKQLPEPICKAMFKASIASANVIATTLQCEDPAAIAADLSGNIVKLGLCADMAQQSTLSDLVCPQVSALVASFVTAPIPAEWKCSATVVSEMIKAQISGQCVKMVK